MLNFEEELKRFKPSLEIEDIDKKTEEQTEEDQQNKTCETMQETK